MTWAYVLTHPIQYVTPVLQQLARGDRTEMEVWYCDGEREACHATAGFGVEFRWDLPLLEGYKFRMLKNQAKHPSHSGFFGLRNLEVRELIRSQRYGAVVINGWHFQTAWQVILA